MSTLTLITVPIGNLDDFTQRAREVLSKERKFIVEDTRSFKSLLGLLDLPVSEYHLISFHDQSQEKADGLIKKMNEGEDLFVASEAGSPLISDPAFPLIQKALKYGHDISTCPGVSAPLVALELSGLPPHPFLFHGFLPRAQGEKERFFDSLIGGMTHLFFEGVTRVEKTLEIMAESFPNGKVAVCRELTKRFEEVSRFNLSEWKERKGSLTYKGEFVLALYLPSDSNKSMANKELVELAEKHLNNPRPRSLAKLLAPILNKSTTEVYNELMKRP